MNKLERNRKNMKLDAAPAVDLSGDLPYKAEYGTNSWFVIGHHEDRGTVFDYLYHVMVLKNKKMPPMIAVCFSATDETHGKFYGDTQVYPILPGCVKKDRLFVKVPSGVLEGDLDRLHIKAKMKHVALDVELYGDGYPLYNCGTGLFKMLGMDIYEYSLPNMKSKGTLKIDGGEYTIDGDAWFDRQWETMNTTSPTWGWMDINLSDRSVLSLWFPIDNGKEEVWATYMAPDGTHQFVKGEPIVTGVTEFWHNEGTVSPYSYPETWHVVIPALALDLNVYPQPKEQELVCDKMPQLSHYEAASRMEGTREGKPVTGYGYIELTGEWGPNMIR